MAKKNKKPTVQSSSGRVISESERLEFIIELNERAITSDDNAINDILEEQVANLHLRLKEAQKKER
jgi:hypothetical protein